MLWNNQRSSSANQSAIYEHHVGLAWTHQNCCTCRDCSRIKNQGALAFIYVSKVHSSCSTRDDVATTCGAPLRSNLRRIECGEVAGVDSNTPSTSARGASGANMSCAA